MAFHFILELPDAPAKTSVAFRKLCDQYVVTRLLVAASRFGATTISVLGPDQVVAEAKTILLRDERILPLPIAWGVVGESPLSVVRGVADVEVGKTAWQLLAEAQSNVVLPGAVYWTKKISPGEAKPLWDETEWQPGRCAIQLKTKADFKRAKDEIFWNITKSTSGPVSRYLNSKLSIPLSKILVETPMTPNQMTVTNTVVGCISALLFGMGTLWSIFWGGIIFQLSSAFDRNDGELARSKFMESERGAWIDTVGDNVTYVAFTICLVYGYARYAQSADVAWAGWVLPLGSGLIVSTVGLIAWMLWYVKKHNLGGSITSISRKFEAELDRKQAGVVYRYLSKLRVLGERDQFSLAVMFFGIMPILTGNDAWYHALFFGFIAVIAAMNIYFMNAAAKLRHAKA